MNRNILNIKAIFLLASIYIALVYADNIRIPKFSWEKIDVVSNVGDDLPEERRDYAIGYSPDQNEIIIFGGRTNDNRVLRDTWIFDLNQHTWRKPLLVKTDNDNPPGRYGMVYGNDQPSSNSFRNAFIITHGKGSNNKMYNDVWSFDFIREAWVEIKATGDIPEARYDALGGIDQTKSSHLNQLSTEYLVFSHGKNNKKHFTDTYVLKLDGRSQQGDYSKLTAEWIKVNTNNAPELKDGATGNMLSSDRLVVFGGCEENKGNCNGKGYYLDINFDVSRSSVEDNATWQEVDNACIRPKAYAAASRGSDISVADYLENDRLIIFGGVTEKKYGADADGEISIFDMDKKKFFGVVPSSSSKEYPKAVKGGKMVTTSPKSNNNNGFSIILYGGEIVGEKAWSNNIWKLNVYEEFTYYPDPPEGVTMTECYTIVEVKGKDNFESETLVNKKESTSSLIAYTLALISIPGAVISTRALNCFTKKWKISFLILAIISIILMIINIILSSSDSKKYISIKIPLICLLILYVVFPFFRPKQPNIDFNQGEVNAAGVPINEPEDSNKNLNNLKPTSSSTYLIDPASKNVNGSEVNTESNYSPASPTNKLNNINIDNKYADNNSNVNSNNGIEKRESFLSPVFINQTIKNNARNDDDDEDEDGDESEDEDEVIKNQFLSRANIWLITLRVVGMIILIGLVVLTLLMSFNKDSKMHNRRIIIYLWIIVVAILYVLAIIIARRKHSSMALLKARKISFRQSDPLEPNPVNSWNVPPNQMKRYSIASESSYGKGSGTGYDDIGNVSNYSQSVRNGPQSSVYMNSNNSNVSPSLNYSIPPLPVTPLYMNNNGLFSLQSNYQNQSPSLTVEPALYANSNIPASNSDYMDINLTDKVTMPNNPTNNLMMTANNEKFSSTSSLNSLAAKEEKLTLGIPTYGNSSFATTNPSPQSQAQLLPNNNFNLQIQNPSNNSSPILEESPVEIIDQDSLEYPQRNNTIEDMNNKEVMMVMTVPKRKLAVVNM